LEGAVAPDEGCTRAHPAKVDYLYFVAKPDKRRHYFTSSFSDFEAYKAAHGYG
jgi:cell division protein YceG involved in septum cleavage